MEKLRKTVALIALLPTLLRGEAMLQYFNSSWVEVTRKMPELAEAGYTSLWLPPPTKASGGLSVGYDCWDRFDLGSVDQRGGVRTFYGTESELIEMVRVAHRFGIRVYFDNIMNHNAFETPGYNEFVPEDVYPGFMPEDFHLRRTADGSYRKWDNVRDWGSEWQVFNLGLSDLIDIATEPGSLNWNHGANEGDTVTKPDYVRHPDQPEFYCYVPTAPGQKHAEGEGAYVGFGPGNGITTASIAADPDFYSERVEHLLNRAARWQIDRTRCDGFRLDAVKHTPPDFFGATFGEDKDSSNYGYTGQIQLQFNLTRGFDDWGNHRNAVFDTERARDDAMLFGEHLGQPPGFGGYIDAGMRLVDNDLRNNLNNVLGNPSASLSGYDGAGSGGFAPEHAVMHAQSHDNSFAARRELQHAMYFTRAGLGLVYSDSNRHAAPLGGGEEFPRIANTSYLGQWGDPRIPNLLKIHQDFARGDQQGRASNADFISYERIDRRGDENMSDADAATMLIAINDNYASGVPLVGGTSFPSAGGEGSENNPDTRDAYLYQYARGYGSQVGFYKYASDLGSVTVDPGSYMVFAPRTPEPSELWDGGSEGGVLAIEQGGVEVGTVEVTRYDGEDGDPGFNPYGLPDADPGDFAYTIGIPRVTDLGDLSFVARTDGSAANLLFRLDAGIDLNGAGAGGDPFLRDNPPKSSNDLFLGYEQPGFVVRRFGEKFAAVDTTRNTIGSQGAETYVKQIGAGSVAVTEGAAGSNDYATDGGELAAFLYHDPADPVGGSPAGGWPGAVPLQYDESGAGIVLWAKPNGVGGGFRMYCYFTTDGSIPEVAGGRPAGTTMVHEMNFSHNQFETDGEGQEITNDWWTTDSLPKPLPGETLTYRIGIFKESDPIYPSGPGSVASKKRAMSVFAVDGFDASSVVHSPHGDYTSSETGLAEGFHILRARAFLERDGKASLYRTYSRTFLVDAARPAGEIVFPGSDGEVVGGSSYGVVVRADASTSSAWYRITDSDASNDDAETGVPNGNGAWVRAQEVSANLGITPSDPAFGREFRFDYVNIPPTGTATIEVRLREISSSADDGVDDASGHFTTLARVVDTAGPEVRMFVAFPGADGEEVGSSYEFKTYFSKALANDEGLSEPEVLERFTVTYGTDDLWPASSVVLDPSGLSVDWDVSGEYHALVFALPVLAKVDPRVPYRVEIFHDRPPGNPDLGADRLVRPATEGDNQPDGDLDGDGIPNGTEWLFGLDPHVPSPEGLPHPQVIAIPGGWMIEFPTLPDRLYQLQESDDLGGWFNLGAPVNTHGIESPPPLVVEDHLLGPAGFYRIAVRSTYRGEL